MAINPGKLKTSVTIQRKVAGRTPGGAKTQESWEDVATVWADVLPLTGREYSRVKQVHAQVTHRVRMRYRTDVTSAHRLKVGTRYLNIVGPPRDVEERHALLEMDCMEVEL